MEVWDTFERENAMVRRMVNSFLDASKVSEVMDLYLAVYLRGTTQTSDRDLTFRRIWQSSPVPAMSTSLRVSTSVHMFVSNQPRDRGYRRKTPYWDGL